MKDLFKLILGILASLFKSRAKLEQKSWFYGNRSMCFAGGHRNDRSSTIPIVFCLFGSIAGSPPFLAQLRLSGRRRSFPGTALGFERIGAGDRATMLADRRSQLSCARSLAR